MKRIFWRAVRWGCLAIVNPCLRLAQLRWQQAADAYVNAPPGTAEASEAWVRWQDWGKRWEQLRRDQIEISLWRA